MTQTTIEKRDQIVVDPVCGMNVELGVGKPSLFHQDKEYHFCSSGCHDKFDKDPEFYLSGASKRKVQDATVGSVYTCPMHPEIVQDHPGDCPLCGMALEPMGIPTDEPNPELIDFTRRFWISAICAVPLLILTMGPLLGLPVREWIGEQRANWNLIYRATRQQYTHEGFHRRCDAAGPTVTILRVEDYVCGGYTPLSWHSENRFIEGEGKSFIFSLENPLKSPGKFHCVQPEREICGYEKNGPNFGGSGAGLYLSSDRYWCDCLGNPKYPWYEKPNHLHYQCHKFLFDKKYTDGEWNIEVYGLDIS